MNKVKVGDIWRDNSGEHNLVIAVIVGHEEWSSSVNVLTLETGRVWKGNPLRDFHEDRYFNKRVA